jgi:hypothetical protein
MGELRNLPPTEVSRMISRRAIPQPIDYSLLMNRQVHESNDDIPILSGVERLPAA